MIKAVLLFFYNRKIAQLNYILGETHIKLSKYQALRNKHTDN